ncbi:MAG TPA: hypothetical protein VFQ54_13470 [Thermomicrobiales bacterium]|nr:hypothetical protein [Thermomicrobiales bacterium]
MTDPTQFIAPPRTEYDYSPLDLAPPGQRRRRQLVVGIVGILAVIVIAAAVVFGYILLKGGDDDNKGPSQQDQLAAAQTVVAQNAARTGTPETDEVAQTDPTVTTAASGADGATDPTKPSTTTTGQAGASNPTPKPTSTTVAGPSLGSLQKLLPAANLMPQGLDTPTDNSKDEKAVVDALGGSRTAQQNLDKWGWSGNAAIEYTASDSSALVPDAVTDVSVSIHGFSTAGDAQDALTFFSDVLLNQSSDGTWTEATDPKVGSKSRMMTQSIDNGDGTTTTNVALYVSDGRVLYRIGGSASNGGDPTDAIIQLATTLLGS